MNVNQSPHSSPFEQDTRKAGWWLAILPALLYAASEFVAIWAGGSRQFWSVLPILIVTPVAYWLTKTRRNVVGNYIFIAAIALQIILVSISQKGLGVPTAVIALVLIVGTGLRALPRTHIRLVVTVGLIVAIASILLDTFGSLGRPVATLVQARWIFATLIFLSFGVVIARQLFLMDLRTKIVLGILGTGGLALAGLVVFAFLQTQQITDSLSTRLDESVGQLSDEQLINRARSAANQVDEAFEDIAEEAMSLAENWVQLRNQRVALSEGAYWDAKTSLIQLDGGQHGNSATDPSSVFVPVSINVDEDVIEDLNVSAYLDFYAPEILESHPALLAVYAIDSRGITRYYPNISLASLLPPDFDTTHRPYYSITTPLFNPQRLPRWAIPYVDATGGGLVVTVSAPVYEGDQFVGIIAADMQLTQITEQINSIKVGNTGYAFLLDDAGRILHMPPAGYEMFGLRPEDIKSDEFFKQTVLGLGTPELQAVTRRMTAGGNGLLVVDVNGVDTYISFSPIPTNGYSVALVVPVSELQGAIASARSQTQQQLRVATQGVVVILILLFILALAASLGLGKVIAAPIQRLTYVASQIAGGDLMAQAEVTTRDEIGTLASAFNTMTGRLRETLDGLEHMVQERTVELSAANERNERRARQFESIAQVARTISSTSDLDVLLPQITNVISQEFGFYHVGIFLLDAAKEYAVLSAANSEGGKRMLSRSHRLKVGETGIVGYVTGSGNPRVALDTGADATYFNNPDLPGTRSEMALPLRVGNHIIGALDVQSTEPNAFSQEDISILSTLSDQVSIAIQNAQRFEETRKALSEAEALSKQFVQVGWQKYTKDKNLVGVRHTGARSTLLYGKNGKEEKPWQKEQDRPKSRGAALSIPIKLRGEVIGSVDVRAPDNRPWDQDELDIVAAIVERAAIAMENARLLEESQRLASKEAKIGEVTARISSSINMRNVLQTAVEELGRALPGSDVIIQFENQQNKHRAAK